MRTRLLRSLVTVECIEETTTGIYVFNRRDEMDIIALSATMLFSLIYALNLNYPCELKDTFDVPQKVVLELEGNTLSKKAQVLKNKLHQ
uniref:Uncharacterized protein n=1 Tax=Gasterosteus aculeatus aculeatus TaxID=481459 RepID=A0AAQ4QGX6_GASAC